MKQLIIGAIFSVVCAGLVFAADQRIDQRVQSAIQSFQEQELMRQQTFYITKGQLAPDKVTPDDKINLIVIEKQLEELRSR